MALRLVLTIMLLTSMALLFAQRDQLIKPISNYIESRDAVSWVMVEGQTSFYNPQPIPPEQARAVTSLGGDTLRIHGWEDFGLPETGRGKFVAIYGIQPKSRLEPDLLRGRQAFAVDDIVIDLELHQYLGLDVDDTVAMGGITYTISGISESYGSTTYNTVFVTQDALRRQTNSDIITSVALWKPIDPTSIPPGLHLRTQQQLINDMQGFIAESSDPLFGLTIGEQILGLSIIIVLVMLIEVWYSRRELGLLRVIGASRRNVMAGEALLDLVMSLAALVVAVISATIVLAVLGWPTVANQIKLIGPTATLSPAHVVYLVLILVAAYAPSIAVRRIILRRPPIAMLKSTD